MEKGEGLAVAVVAACALLAGGSMLIPQHGIFREPHSLTKTFAILSVALRALAAPFAIAEGRSDRRFRLLRRRIEEERAWARVAAYEGPFGRGVEFLDEGRRVLLLHPVGGLGAPFVVEEALAAPAAAPEGFELPVLAEPPEGARG